MKSNFHSNQILYVKGIGYARIAIDGQKSSKSNQIIKQVQNSQNQPIQQVNDQNSDAVLFDPDMFNIDADSPFGYTSVQINLAEHNTRKKSIQVSRRASTQLKNRELIIVPLKLQQTNAMIYCPETCLMKKVTLIVKSLLQNNRKQIQLNIQITKTIDNLKNVILKELGQQIGHYSDIKIYSASPRLEQLNIGSKTLWQYNLKDRCKLSLAGRFNFTFKNLPAGKQKQFTLSNGNNTINYVAPVVKKQQIINTNQLNIQSPITNTNQVATNTINPSTLVQTVQISKQTLQVQASKEVQASKIPENKQEIKKQQTVKNAIQQVPQSKLHLESNIKIRSGLHYWQIKIDKLNVNSNQDQTAFLIGICLKSQEQSLTQNYLHLWGYDIIRSKKVEIIKSSKSQQKIQEKEDQQINGQDQSDEQYGSIVKTGDSIGVLLIIKQKKGSLIFYKNSTCLEICYEFDVQKLRKKQTKNEFYIRPFISIMGEIQGTLDSKASPPLDSYRYK